MTRLLGWIFNRPFREIAPNEDKRKQSPRRCFPGYIVPRLLDGNRVFQLLTIQENHTSTDVAPHIHLVPPFNSISNQRTGSIAIPASTNDSSDITAVSGCLESTFKFAPSSPRLTDPPCGRLQTQFSMINNIWRKISRANFYW